MRIVSRISLLFFSTIILSCNSGEAGRDFSEEDINIIPKPVELKLDEGSFSFDANTKFVVSNEQEKEFSSLLIDKFAKVAGWDLETLEAAPESNYIQFKTNEELEEEAYELEITDEVVTITANSIGGFIYGMESIRQLLPPEIEKDGQVSDVSWQIPNLKIIDHPRYEWRGLHLDVARHFLPKEYIHDVIDRMAMFKLNTLHFHLIDDQGWRIEIKKYPKLAEVGGFRADHEHMHWNARPEPQPGEPTTYGGYYTQEEIKEIVAHAASKGITVVPEIEMPAHVMSAIAAYPELSCFEKEIMVPTGGVWPITEIFCAGKDSTFDFLENVLLEVMELFPSEYIHVGGDEATKTNWKICPNCQRRMAEEGLEDVEELQSYFMKRMEGFLSSHDRILVGWDEILEGGLAPGATVMSWRGFEGGWEASERGHDVIMTPVSHMYFDYYQGNPDTEPTAFGGQINLSKVYEFDPIVDSMSVDQKNHVLGGQANMWSEFIPDPSHSEYMMFPRLAALSETVWSPKETRDWADFSKRLKIMFERFDYMDINYAKSAFAVTADTEINLADNSVEVQLETEFPDSVIRYTLGEEELTVDSEVYEAPFEISGTTTVKAAVFENGQQKGQSLEKTFQFHKAVGKEVAYDPVYHNSYQGAKEVGMVNVLRGTLNFHDGQWQAWLVDDMEVVINMDEASVMSQVSVGTMEDQGSGIYFPTKVEVFLSEDGELYKSVGSNERDFAHNGNPSLQDFKVEFEEQKAAFVKVKVTNLGHPPTGGSAWLFIDEIVIE